MPVEIKELVIRAVVADAPETAANVSASAPEVSPDDTEAIVAACVKQVLAILKQTQEC